jgi:Putative MetA-pathway of phenol degradation
MRRLALALALLLFAEPAAAQGADFCADRPGLGTPACTMPPGQVMVELGLAGWDHSVDQAATEDDLTYGDALVRVGIDDRTELEGGFGGYGTVRSRDRLSGTVSHGRGLGDVTLAVRRSLSGPGGPVALHIFATLPTGSAGISAGDWGGGATLPSSASLPAGFELDLTPEIDAAVNASGKGRHLAWGGVVGLGHPLGSQLSVEAEIAAWRDNDPAGHATDARAALSLAWQAGKDWQIDLEGDAGLTAAAPRHALLIGMARRF